MIPEPERGIRWNIMTARIPKFVSNAELQLIRAESAIKIFGRRKNDADDDGDHDNKNNENNKNNNKNNSKNWSWR